MSRNPVLLTVFGQSGNAANYLQPSLPMRTEAVQLRDGLIVLAFQLLDQGLCGHRFLMKFGRPFFSLQQFQNDLSFLFGGVLFSLFHNFSLHLIFILFVVRFFGVHLTLNILSPINLISFFAIIKPHFFY